MPIVARSDQVVTPVLGMHRSGTSMFMRMLSFLGVEIGENHLPADQYNKSGYWEDRFLLKTDVKLLRALGCDWRGFAPRPTLLRAAQLLKNANIDPNSAAVIAQYLESSFQSSCWGWKDPRTVLTYPCWHRFLLNQGYQKIRPIVLVRHPAECARSLAKVFPPDRGKDYCPVELGLEMWTCYYEVLRSYLEADWPVLAHRDLLDPKTAEPVLRRVCEYLELDAGSLSQAVESIDLGLLSQKTTEEAIDDPQRKELYQFFIDRAVKKGE